MTQQAPKLRERLEVFDLLDKLEGMSGAKLPLTGRILVNPLELQDLVAKLRRALPRDITEAQQIIRYRDTFVSQAQGEAKRIRSLADEEAMKKVSEAQIVKEAQKTAEQIKTGAQDSVKVIITNAEAQARQRTAGADAYAIDVLRKLEEELNTLLLTARRGLETLQSGRELDEGDR